MRFSSLVSMLVILCSLLVWDQVSANNAITPNPPHLINYSFSDTTYRIISSTPDTYGYEILINGKAFIRQKNVPGLPGSTGFKRKEDAEKAARLVLKKLTAGFMPPSIDKHELDSMKVKY